MCISASFAKFLRVPIWENIYIYIVCNTVLPQSKGMSQKQERSSQVKENIAKREVLEVIAVK